MTELDENAYVQMCHPVDHQKPFRETGTKEVNLSDLSDQGHKWVPKATHIQIMTERAPRLMAFRGAVRADITTPRPTHFALSYGFLVSAFGSCIRCHLDSTLDSTRS